jgi:hypothetical protein
VSYAGNNNGPVWNRRLDEDGEDRTYNGWTNRATWNVALWLREDWSSTLTEWAKDREYIQTAADFRRALEHAIVELDVRQYFLAPIKGTEASQFFTPDGDRFDDANWDELFFELILEQREPVEE